MGELRELVVPSQYGYGEFPVGDKIPPRALLVFYVELLKITDPGEDSGRPNMFKEIDVNGDGLISHSEVGQMKKNDLNLNLVISSRAEILQSINRKWFVRFGTKNSSETFRNPLKLSLFLDSSPEKFRFSPAARSPTVDNKLKFENSISQNTKRIGQICCFYSIYYCAEYMYNLRT